MIVGVTVKSDRDNDQIISFLEAQRLALKIEIALRDHEVQFDRDKFCRAIGGDTTVAAVIAMVRRMLSVEDAGSGDGDGEEAGEDLDDDVYDVFHMQQEGPEEGPSLMKSGRLKEQRRASQEMRLKKSEQAFFKRSVSPGSYSPGAGYQSFGSEKSDEGSWSEGSV